MNHTLHEFVCVFVCDCRIGKQCRERWHNNLDPNINRKAWTEDEDRAILEVCELLTCTPELL